MQHGNRPVALTTPVYGILAVGKYFRFFRYNDAQQACNDWLPGPSWPRTHKDEKCYMLDRDVNRVQTQSCR